MLNELSIETWGAEDRVIAPNEVYLCEDLIEAGIYTRAPQGSDAPFQQQPIGWTWRRWWYPDWDNALLALGVFRFVSGVRPLITPGNNAAGVEGWWTPWFLFRDTDGYSAPSDLAQAVAGPWELFTGKIIPRAPVNTWAPEEQAEPVPQPTPSEDDAWTEFKRSTLGVPRAGDDFMVRQQGDTYAPTRILQVRPALEPDTWWVLVEGSANWLQARRDLVLPNATRA